MWDHLVKSDCDDIPPFDGELVDRGWPIPVAVPVMTIVFGICDS
jgi:hypothetical protein